MDQKSYQLGGIVLILSALAAAVGSFLHGPQPDTLDAYNALGASWQISHVSISVSAVLLLIGSLFLARHFAGTAGNGPALVAAGSLIVGGVAIFALGALETSGFSAAAAEVGDPLEVGFDDVSPGMQIGEEHRSHPAEARVLGADAAVSGARALRLPSLAASAAGLGFPLYWAVARSACLQSRFT